VDKNPNAIVRGESGIFTGRNFLAYDDGVTVSVKEMVVMIRPACTGGTMRMKHVISKSPFMSMKNKRSG